jgi:hypothetical protein
MSAEPGLLVAFLNGNAGVGPGAPAKWWLDAKVQDRLQLTDEQIRTLDETHDQASSTDLTQTLWRMYQTLSPPQRLVFAQLLEVRRRPRESRNGL